MFAVTGCTVSHVPEPSSIDADLPDLRGSVSLSNAQPDKTERELGSAGFGTMKGNLNAWSDSSIALLKQSFEEAGLQVVPGAPKSLQVSVVEVALDVSGINFVAAVPKCKVRLHVETGDGYSNDYTSENNAMSPPGACDDALSEATEDVLSDPRIVAYLK
jgi:hypothetical protein